MYVERSWSLVAATNKHPFHGSQSERSPGVSGGVGTVRWERISIACEKDNLGMILNLKPHHRLGLLVTHGGCTQSRRRIKCSAVWGRPMQGNVILCHCLPRVGESRAEQNRGIEKYIVIVMSLGDHFAETQG